MDWILALLICIVILGITGYLINVWAYKTREKLRMRLLMHLMKNEGLSDKEIYSIISRMSKD